MILRLEDSELSPASFETPEILPEGRGLAVSQEWQPGLLIPHPSQLAPDWICAKPRAALLQLRKEPFWMLLSQLDINTQNKVQSNKDGGMPGYFLVLPECPVSWHNEPVTAKEAL